MILRAAAAAVSSSIASVDKFNEANSHCKKSQSLQFFNYHFLMIFTKCEKVFIEMFVLLYYNVKSQSNK